MSENTIINQLRNLTSEEFYKQYPEFKPLDNGEGIALELNKNVAMSEFTQFGKDLLKSKGITDSSYKDIRLAAAESLLSKLAKQSDDFVKYYVEEIMDLQVARYLQHNDKSGILASASVYIEPLPKARDTTNYAPSPKYNKIF